MKIDQMKKIQKQVKKDHALSQELFDTGNYDAQYLAGRETREARLDLAYEDDSRAEVDMNIVKTGDGRFITVGWMKGRSRPYQVEMRHGAPRTALAIAFNDKCDVVVATVAAMRGLVHPQRGPSMMVSARSPIAAVPSGMPMRSSC